MSGGGGGGGEVGGGGGGKGVGGGGASSAEMGEAAAPPPAGTGKGNDGGVQEKAEALEKRTVLFGDEVWWDGKVYRRLRHLTNEASKPWWADKFLPWQL